MWGCNRRSVLEQDFETFDFRQGLISLGLHLISLGLHLISLGLHLISLGLHLISLGLHLISFGLRLISFGLCLISFGLCLRFLRLHLFRLSHYGIQMILNAPLLAQVVLPRLILVISTGFLRKGF